MSELEVRIDRLIEEIDLCLELLGYERKALERMGEDRYMEPMGEYDREIYRSIKEMNEHRGEGRS